MSGIASWHVEKVFDHTISSLDRARRNLDRQAVEAVIGVLASASDILFAGVGASGIIARDAQQKFPFFGVPCQAPADAYQQLMAANMSRPGSVTFAISTSGQRAETSRVAQAAKEAAARVIAMTGQPGPLLELADVGLVVRSFADTDASAPSSSRLGGLVVIDILATAVLLQRNPQRTYATTNEPTWRKRLRLVRAVRQSVPMVTDGCDVADDGQPSGNGEDRNA